jgi:hypothetical protein
MAKESLILRFPFLQWLLAHLFPRLRQWSVQEWPTVLGKARQVEFDRLEQIATLAGVIVVAWQVKPVTSLGASALISYLVQFVYLVPVLLLVLGPFFVRRIRRGLNAAVRNRDAATEARDGQQ